MVIGGGKEVSQSGVKRVKSSGDLALKSNYNLGSDRLRIEM